LIGSCTCALGYSGSVKYEQGVLSGCNKCPDGTWSTDGTACTPIPCTTLGYAGDAGSCRCWNGYSGSVSYVGGMLSGCKPIECPSPEYKGLAGSCVCAEPLYTGSTIYLNGKVSGCAKAPETPPINTPTAVLSGSLQLNLPNSDIDKQALNLVMRSSISAFMGVRKDMVEILSITNKPFRRILKRRLVAGSYLIKFVLRYSSEASAVAGKSKIEKLSNEQGALVEIIKSQGVNNNIWSPTAANLISVKIESADVNVQTLPGNKMSSMLIAGIAAGGSVGGIILVVFAIYKYRQYKKRPQTILTFTQAFDPQLNVNPVRSVAALPSRPTSMKNMTVTKTKPLTAQFEEDLTNVAQSGKDRKAAGDKWIEMTEEGTKRVYYYDPVTHESRVSIVLYIF
jgi:hypothetical protein